MTAHVLDVRGQPCPLPVVRTRKAMDTETEMMVLVSTDDQAGNVSRMAERSGWTVQTEKKSDHLQLTLRKGETSQEPQVVPEDLVCATPQSTKSKIVVITSDCMGKGPEDLGRILMRSFLGVMKEVDRKPHRLIFYNSGVKLVVEGSPVLLEIQELSDRGIEIMACGTCLDFFNIKDKLAVGRISNMYEIASNMLNSDNALFI